MPTSQTKRSPFLAQVNTPWKIRLYFLKKLPSCWWWGIRVEHIGEQVGEVSIPYTWRTQNPFKSIYFAAQSGAAELSTGLIAAAAIQDQPPISMLITQVEARFLKKATQRVCFKCLDGAAICEAVRLAIETGEAQTLRATSKGYQADGLQVSEFVFTWSFKRKA